MAFEIRAVRGGVQSSRLLWAGMPTASAAAGLLPARQNFVQYAARPESAAVGDGHGFRLVLQTRGVAHPGPSEQHAVRNPFQELAACFA
eukprot:5917340-Alexandrium_andersonii.AAC.1